MPSMAYDDDTLDSPSLSRDFGKSKEVQRLQNLKDKLKHEGKHVAADKSEAELKGLKLSVLKQDVEGKKDEEKKRDEKTEKKAIGTKTREQALKQDKLAGNTKLSTDQIVSQGQKQAKIDEEIKEQEVSGEDA